MCTHKLIVCLGGSKADGIIEYFVHFNPLVLLVDNFGRVYREAPIMVGGSNWMYMNRQR